MTDDEFTADGEDPGEVEAGERDAYEFESPVGRVQIPVMRPPPPVDIRVSYGGDLDPDAVREAVEKALRPEIEAGERLVQLGNNFGRHPLHGTVEGVRMQLGELLSEVLPPGIEVHGLVLDHVIRRGWPRRWRRWALRLGLWLIRKSGCEVVKP